MDCPNCKIEMLERANHWYCTHCTGVVLKTYAFFWKDKVGSTCEYLANNCMIDPQLPDYCPDRSCKKYNIRGGSE